VLPSLQVTDIHQIDTRYTNLKDIKENVNNSHPKPSMSQVALTPLGLPSLATNHKALKDQSK
jgi:hypothetical protein